MTSLPPFFVVQEEVQRALKHNEPVVALESAVLTHGLPEPVNLEFGRAIQQRLRDQGVIPATIAVLHGRIRIGLTDQEIGELIASATVKISRRDFAPAVARRLSGGTTVAGTMLAANRAGIRVFATGGIGGVHRESRMDVSADLQALAFTPMVVVCAGAKSILNLEATLELLETLSVPVLGYGTDEFPAFFSRQSGLRVNIRVDTPEEAAEFARTHWDLGMNSAVLVCQPIPEADELPRHEIDPIEEQASREAIAQGIHGQSLTPFLLRRVNELSQGRSLRANLSLLYNNVRLAGEIARAMLPRWPKKIV